MLAQSFAAVALAGSGLPLRGDLVLEAVVGEECMNHEIGVSATHSRGYAADGAVAFEPTTGSEAAEIMLVCPGQLRFTMSVRGKVTQHAANRGQTLRPGEGVEPPGVSAIDKGFLLDAGLRRLEQEWAFSKCHPLYRPAQFTIMPEVIESGTTGVQFPLFAPEFVRTEYLVRYPLDADADAVIAEIEAHVGAVAATDPRLAEHEPIDWRLHWPSNAPRAEAITAATCGAKQRAANRTRFAGRAQVTGFPAVADATWRTFGGIPAISFGRRDSAVAHADDEFVRVDEVLCVTRLRPACLEWCGVFG